VWVFAFKQVSLGLVAVGGWERYVVEAAHTLDLLELWDDRR